jgi:hypothetical protein
VTGEQARCLFFGRIFFDGDDVPGHHFADIHCVPPLSGIIPYHVFTGDSALLPFMQW